MRFVLCLSLVGAAAAFVAPRAVDAGFVFEPGWFAALQLSGWERETVGGCPCANPTLCLPVAATTASAPPKPEVYAFSVTTDDRWRHYDWNKVTTIAWNEDKELLCHAHARGVKVVIKHNFDETERLCDPTARREWIAETYRRIVQNFADGVNIDTEKAMAGATTRCQTELVRELREELARHEFTKNAQVTFDVSWAPRGVDGRYYQWKELAELVDFLFVMSYDMRSQIYYQCLAGANSPLALVKQGLEEFLYGYDIAPNKLVLGLPWYGYQYPCETYTPENKVCEMATAPFFGAPCSDAAGNQVDVGDIRRLLREDGGDVARRVEEHWDPMSQTPFVVYENASTGRVNALWYDNATSLALKSALVGALGLRGVGMWNADSLDYAGDPHGSQEIWDALTSFGV